MVDREASAKDIHDDLDVASLWLREFAHHEGVEVSTMAEEQMLRLGMSLLDVHYVLANGRLVFCDKDEVGCVFAIAGETCDEHVLEVTGSFASGHMFLRIESITLGA